MQGVDPGLFLSKKCLRERLHDRKNRILDNLGIFGGMKKVIRFDRVSKVFGNEKVLNSIDLEIKSGESVVLIGPSGSGKSLILKLISGLLNPTSGSIYINGKDLETLSHDERILLFRSMGMLFQKNALFDSLTVKDNVCFPLRETTDKSQFEIEEIAEYFLKEVGLDHVLDHFPDEISGGMQKRLGIARALALAPEIILYDDPTAGLDPITSRKIVDLILNLKDSGSSTLVTVTNEMNRAYQLADKIVMIVDGEAIVTGNESETKSFQDKRVQQFIKGQVDGPLTDLQ